MKMEEVALYSVKDGKIVKDEFFYTMWQVLPGERQKALYLEYFTGSKAS